MNQQQYQRIKSGQGFIAALDQSGGSTPSALAHYGIGKDAYSTDEEMFALMHQMRSRMAQSPSFDGSRIIGTILFENTLDREIAGLPSAEYLWGIKTIVPFLKVDRGLDEVRDGVQLMRPITDLSALLAKGVDKGVFGTKMRSFVKLANPDGINAIADQQFEVARQILAAGLVPILEPEVDIHSPEKADAEAQLKAAILERLSGLGSDELVMVKLTLPEVDDFNSDLLDHPNVLRVVALSGGYSRDEANARLARNHGIIASFSRALAEGLTVDQSDDEFHAVLAASIASIYEASIT